MLRNGETETLRSLAGRTFQGFSAAWTKLSRLPSADECATCGLESQPSNSASASRVACSSRFLGFYEKHICMQRNDVIPTLARELLVFMKNI